ncbi:DUF742 domain-containing protein [Rhodococcus coprophilus]|uniref:Protein of uncharacterized function (DUF742) n=1 Tax=Rhodococcus coprophilus TaxID=38310 RepID=A0A2X4TRM4_9NOCA|nr:DUF742 domain-containing protein [Rhodococcus coprophilus]MBM7461200.1 hypothetical protein [Rhodococcus coprophilus]SQI29029.1 Protein of uncharacterised function (DUF742) [Rhodococcus coprophilus]
MSVADSEWPIVGATGARFGTARSRQRRNKPDADLAQRGRTEEVPTPGGVSGRAEVVDGVLAGRSAMSVTRGSEIDVGNEDMDQPETSSFVRPFVRIGGRTRAEVELPLEALVSAVPSAQGSERGFALEEHRTVLALCVQPRSIMEVAALAGIPLGVARVLVGDLAATGELTVHRTVDRVGPGVDLLERVLVGLHGL